MKHEPMDAKGYPDVIQAEAKGGEIVEYIRTDVAKEREEKLISAAYAEGLSISPAGTPYIYFRAGLEELK